MLPGLSSDDATLAAIIPGLSRARQQASMSDIDTEDVYVQLIQRVLERKAACAAEGPNFKKRPRRSHVTFHLRSLDRCSIRDVTCKIMTQLAFRLFLLARMLIDRRLKWRHALKVRTANGVFGLICVVV